MMMMMNVRIQNMIIMKDELMNIDDGELIEDISILVYN